MKPLFCVSALGAVLLLANNGMADVSISGDSRARYVLKDNYNFGNNDSGTVDRMDSRVRFVFLGKLESGAYAKARLRFDYNKWGSPDDYKFWGDYAYLSIPVGQFRLEAGRIKSNLTKFTEWDEGADQIAADWNMAGIDSTLIYRINSEGTASDFEVDAKNDNDNISYGLVLQKVLNESITTQLNLFYQDDQRDSWTTGEYITDASGLNASIYLAGTHDNFGWAGEFSFKEEDTLQQRDSEGLVSNPEDLDRGNGWGWYVSTKYDFESFTPSLNVGMAANGFKADNDFGWIMLGNSNNEPITVVSQLGEDGDWFWIAPSVTVQATESLKVIGNFVWASVDAVDQQEGVDLYYEDFYEFSADLTYTLYKDVTFTWKVGVLQPKLAGTFSGEEVSEDLAVGTYGRLQIKF